MAMIPFYSKFHDLAIHETRSVLVRGYDQIPNGEYGFIEFYCDDFHCDCRRVLINVISPTTKGKVWATINYGWEDRSYYEKWMGDKELAEEAVGATLDPLNLQTEYAPALLDLFHFLIQDKAYVERLRRHYEIFRDSLRPSKTPFGTHRRKRRK